MKRGHHWQMDEQLGLISYLADITLKKTHVGCWLTSKTRKLPDALLQQGVHIHDHHVENAVQDEKHFATLDC